jgi:hypothetical protein
MIDDSCVVVVAVVAEAVEVVVAACDTNESFLSTRLMHLFLEPCLLRMVLQRHPTSVPIVRMYAKVCAAHL